MNLTLPQRIMAALATIAGALVLRDLIPEEMLGCHVTSLEGPHFIDSLYDSLGLSGMTLAVWLVVDHFYEIRLSRKAKAKQGSIEEE